MSEKSISRAKEVAAAAAAFFGEPVLGVTAPGGKLRASCRVHFASRDIIVTRRNDRKQAALELAILQHFQTLTDRVPKFLGATGPFLFQSDAGSNRLNRAIYAVTADHRIDLAAQAVDALFEIQRAAIRSGLVNGQTAANIVPANDDKVLLSVKHLVEILSCVPTGFDSRKLHPWFKAPAVRFVKWDCRAGNAAIDASGYLRFFDFEGSRFAHGPEDFAWLIADETWPVPMEIMLGLVRARLTEADTTDPDGYMEYLEQFIVLQALRRVRLIFSEAQRAGWLDRITILKYDKVGTNPHLCERLCGMAIEIARRNPATAPLQVLFERAITACRKARAA